MGSLGIEGGTIGLTISFGLSQDQGCSIDLYNGCVLPQRQSRFSSLSSRTFGLGRASRRVQ